MSDLKLDLELLGGLAQDLDAVVKEFTDADDISDDVASAVGDGRLAGHVRDFAHKWNGKRESMTKDVQALQGQITSISVDFTQVDEGLAKALEQAAGEVVPTVQVGPGAFIGPRATASPTPFIGPTALASPAPFIGPTAMAGVTP